VDTQVRAVTTLTTGGTSRARRSPVAESLSRIAAYPAEGHRTVLVVSDLRERSSVFNLECGRPPSEARFIRALATHGLLTPGSLAGADVFLAFAQGRPLENRRCASSIARETAVSNLWRVALEQAGAARVLVSQTVPSFASTPSPEPLDQTETSP
jgi:hypothetical protein